MKASKILWVIIAAVAFFIALPQFMPRFYVYIISLIFVTGLLATSLNIVLGFGGMYQFHHAVFYGAGAYATALIIKKTGLPLWNAILAAPLAGALLSLILGIICVRLSKLYFGMLQLSLGSLVWAIVYRWYSFTGGDDGLHVSTDLSTTDSYYLAFAITGLSLFVIYKIINSPFGTTFQAIRDNPERREAIGVNVKMHRLLGLVIAGFFAGVAGSLFVLVEGCAFPELMFWTLSLEIIIMCLLGGWVTFLGPMLGAAMIVGLRTFAGMYTEYWTMVLGIILMLLILFLPQGVLGYFQEKRFVKRIISEDG